MSLIPHSTALAEAKIDSLSELYSRDPEGYSKIDLDRLVADLRLQRERWAKTEAEGKKTPAKAKSLIAAGNPEDLGL